MNTIVSLIIAIVTPFVMFLLANPLWILILFIVFFLLVPMLKVVFGK